VAKEKTTVQYGADQIQLLEGLEAVRRRPGMYIGGTGEKALHHMVNEVVDNAIDEAMQGRCDTIRVTIHKDESVSVEDNGAGIPVDIQKQTGIPALTLVMTKLHAGGKFGDGGYKVSGGLHGVGVSAVNALSTWLETTVKRDGKIHRQRFEQGAPVTEIDVIGKCKKGDTGTIQTFLRDDTIFEATSYDWDTLATRFREMAFLTRGVDITLIDERPEEVREMTFYFEGGVKSFVRYLNRNRTSLHEPIHVDQQVETTHVEAAIQYTDGFSESLLAFANTINTPDGGTHLTGLRAAITRQINDYCRKQGFLKENDHNFTGDDTRQGLTALVSVKIFEPQFEGQNKLKLLNNEVRYHVETAVADAMNQWMDENPREVKQIVEKCRTAYRAREAARKARDLVIRKSALESLTLPGKLADCSSRNPDECEIYIVEGDSAGGTAKQGRDRRFQAILPLRGKILNIEKTSLDKALTNKEIQALITALGTNIGESFDLEGLRYNRIILMSVDSDELTFIKDPEGQVSSVRIGEFIDEMLLVNEDPSKYQVLCFSPTNGEVHYRPLKSVIRHSHDGPLYEIETSYGRRVRVTGSHSVFVSDEHGYPVLKRGDEVEVGDIMAVPEELPFTGFDASNGMPHIDLLRSFVERNTTGKLDIQLNVQGPGVEEWHKNKLWEELSNDPAMTEKRVTIPPVIEAIIHSQCQSMGLTEYDIYNAIGAPDSIHAWGLGDDRPTLSYFMGYIERIGLRSDSILSQVEVGESFLDTIWNTPDNEIFSSRVRDYIPLEDLKLEDLGNLGEHVTLSLKHSFEKALPRFIPVDDSLMLLLGFFVSKGFNISQHEVRWFISRSDEMLVAELQSALYTTFGLYAEFEPGSERRSGELCLRNKVAAAIFRLFFDSMKITTSTKYIPDLIFNLNHDLQESFIRGYFLGNGIISANHIFSTTFSKTLAEQLMYLLQNNGIRVTLSEEQSSSGIGERSWDYTTYYVTITEKDSLIRLLDMWSDDVRSEELFMRLDAQNSSDEMIPMVGHLAGLEVRSIREVEATNNYVYDFSVEGDETFICGRGGICCHNTDADVDGSHIRTLLLTFFFRYMQELVQDGHLYIAQPPLYRVTKTEQVNGRNKRSSDYVYDEKALEELRDELGNPNVRIDQRYKGLGEMNDEQLWETTMNPENRTILQVNIDDASEADQTFDMLMGSSVPPRRRFIQTHANQARLDV